MSLRVLASLGRGFRFLEAVLTGERTGTSSVFVDLLTEFWSVWPRAGFSSSPTRAGGQAWLLFRRWALGIGWLTFIRFVFPTKDKGEGPTPLVVSAIRLKTGQSWVTSEGLTEPADLLPA